MFLYWQHFAEIYLYKKEVPFISLAMHFELLEEIDLIQEEFLPIAEIYCPVRHKFL